MLLYGFAMMSNWINDLSPGKIHYNGTKYYMPASIYQMYFNEGMLLIYPRSVYRVISENIITLQHIGSAYI